MRKFACLHLLILVSISTSYLYSQYQNIRVDGPQSYQPEEVTIAINPLNPNILAAGANIDHFYVSTDAGNTWSESRLVSNLLGVWGDPVVLFDSLGNLYYSHLSNPVSGWWIDRIVVQKSTDNGQSWNDGVGVGLNNYPKQQDKEWLAVDLTQSPYRGNVYMTWTEFDDYGSSNPDDSSRIRFSKSTDEGETWSDAITISDVSGNCIDGDLTTEGAVPCVGPNGEIYVSWAGPAGIVFDKSADGGETWGSDVFVNSMPGGWAFDIPGISRCNGLPITMCDISNSQYNGHIYIVWSDQRNGTTNTDIFMSKSTDEGETWSPQLKINDDNTTRHQFFVWSDIDQSTGHIWCVFYDRRNTTGVDTDVFVAKSIDGGATFENFKVSESSFTPTPSIFFGDYTNISAWNGKIYPIWMRLHNSQLTVWVAPLTDSSTVSSSDLNQTQPDDFVLFQNYPNPFNPSTTISYQLPADAFVTLTVFDVLGNEIETLTRDFMQAGVHEVNYNAEKLSSGMYFYKLKANAFERMKKMILIK